MNFTKGPELYNSIQFTL